MRFLSHILSSQRFGKNESVQNWPAVLLKTTFLSFKIIEIVR